MKLSLILISLMVGVIGCSDYKEGEVYFRVMQRDNPFVKSDTVYMKVIAVKDGWFRYSNSWNDTLNFRESIFSPQKTDYAIKEFYYTKIK